MNCIGNFPFFSYASQCCTETTHPATSCWVRQLISLAAWPQKPYWCWSCLGFSASVAASFSALTVCTQSLLLCRPGRMNRQGSSESWRNEAMGLSSLETAGNAPPHWHWCIENRNWKNREHRFHFAFCISTLRAKPFTGLSNPLKYNMKQIEIRMNN